MNFLKSKTFLVVLNSKRTFLLQRWNAWVSITEKNIENNVGAKTSPYLSPLFTGVSFDNLPLMITLSFIPQCNFLNIFTNISGHPIFPSIVPRVSLLTVSKTLFKSTKTLYRGTCWSMHFSSACLTENIMLVVSLPDLKPLYEWVHDICSKATDSSRMLKTLPTASKRVSLR